MNNKPSSAVALPAAPVRLLVLLVMLCAVLALNAFFLASPGDGGSGIGGTGKFGGESGLGGTGGPVKLGAAGLEQEEEERLPARPLLRADGPALAAAPGMTLNMENLRLSPPAAPPALPAFPASGLDEALAERARESREAEMRRLRETLGGVNPSAGTAPDRTAPGVETLMARESSSAARALSSSLEIIRELMLAEAAVEMPLPGLGGEAAAESFSGETPGERPRVDLPARPERPDRPTMPNRRFTAPQRDIPAPPVRPMRI